MVILQSLRTRSRLAPADATHLDNLEKGYAGEIQFDRRISAADCRGYVINDLLLDYRGTLFQIDTVLLQPDVVYLFDVKNFYGDFIIEDEKWTSANKETEIKNPLLQLKRTEFAFRNLLKVHGFSPVIRSFLVFINPEFHLFQAPGDLPAIFSSQLNRFLSGLSRQSAATPLYRDEALAQKLLSLHLEGNPYSRIPEFDEKDLRKGICCPGCWSFLPANQNKQYVVCTTCGNRESNTEAVLRTVKEFRTLFPDKQLRTRIITEWCGIVDRQVIQRVLQKHFTSGGKGPSSYYVSS
ncbi:nuclease-related domain-containing protein [Alteribacter natronophilus]|uniref:nuclease-related domain-containing protein n=1 Tax=Alteribacter natronophilus TaxID=2583810 RepID=UPI001FE3B5AA|nr:nuclease-related domain-containing protein [Alteribacter natronophilus]